MSFSGEHEICVSGLTIRTLVCAHAMFFLYMYQATGIPLGGLFLAYENYGSDGYYGVSADDQNNALVVGQSVYFVTLVVLQWQAGVAVRECYSR